MWIYSISKTDRAWFVNRYIDFFKSLNVFIRCRGMLDECDAVHALQAKLEGVFEVWGLQLYEQKVFLFNIDLLIFENHWKLDCLSVNKFERSHLDVLALVWLKPDSTDWISILVSWIKVILVLFFSKSNSEVSYSMIIIPISHFLIKMSFMHTLKVYGVVSFFRKYNWSEICSECCLQCLYRVGTATVELEWRFKLQSRPFGLLLFLLLLKSLFRILFLCLLLLSLPLFAQLDLLFLLLCVYFLWQTHISAVKFLREDPRCLVLWDVVADRRPSNK